VPDNGTQSSLSWSFSTGLHQLCVVVGRLLGEFVVSWLMGIFVDIFFVQYLSLKDSGACKKQIKQKNISFETL